MPNALTIAGVAALVALAARAWRCRMMAKQASRDSFELSLVAAMSARLPRSAELGELLHAAVDAIALECDTERVLLRLYNPRTRLFEPRAYAGLDHDLIHSLSNRDVDLESFRQSVNGHDHVVFAADSTSLADAALCRSRSQGLLVAALGEVGAADGYFAIEIPPGAGDGWVGERVRALRVFANSLAQAMDAARAKGQAEQLDTELALASDKLKELQKLKDNFVGAVSHELRTPLTSVKAYAETLTRVGEDVDADLLREFAGVILHESDRLNEALDDILDVAQLESGRARFLAQDVDLVASCKEAVTSRQFEWEEHGLRIELDAPDTKVELRADKVAVEQVLDHLLDNARKFTPAGGGVVVRVREEVSMARIEIEDDGIGIPENELQRVFERFHQVDNSSTRSFGGQGLGLALCEELVRWHNGRIWAEARSGGGTRFVVLLPNKGLVVRPVSQDAVDGSDPMERNQFLHLLIGFVAETMGVHIASLMLVDEEDDRLLLEAAVGLEDEVVRSVRLRRGEGIAGHVWESGQSLLVTDLDSDGRFDGRVNNVQYTTRGLLSCPLLRDGEAIGVVNVNNRADGRVFSEDDRVLLEALCERMERALDAFKNFATGKARLSSANAALRATLDVARERRSPVREILFEVGMRTADELGLGADEMRNLAFALRSYDLGLAHVDGAVLHKRGPLDAEDRRALDHHVNMGVDLAEGLGASPAIVRILSHHHENFDGSGYPEGLAGEAIPLGARIVRLVDHSHGLLRERERRPALALDELEHALRDGAGQLFCPRIAPIFLNALAVRRDELREVARDRSPVPVATEDGS